MLFWIIVALLAAAVTYAVTLPLTRPREDVAGARNADIAVYKDQLAEIEADQARGTLQAGEAQLARTEIARRLLRKSGGDDGSAGRGGGFQIKPVALAVTAALPLISLGVYLAYGHPGEPGQPLAERLAEKPTEGTANDLVARVEKRLREHPEDGQGWNVIAPVYYAMQRYNDAASAYATAMRILGETPERLMGFANARIQAQNGLVPEDARAALERVIKVEPQRKEARVWIAFAKEQDGKTAEAASEYRELIKGADGEPGLKAFLEARIAAIDGRSPPAAGAQTGPSAAQASPSAADIQAMPQAEREAAIATMVERLALRLKSDAKDVKGWMMLIRSYQMLGRKEDAQKALGDARRGLEGDAAAISQVDGLAKELGLGS